MSNQDQKSVFTEEEKNVLFEDNVNLIHKVAQHFSSKTVEYDELFSEATVGFTKALNTFDDSRNTKFTTFAFECMKRQILSYLRGDTKRTKLKCCSLDEMAVIKNNTAPVNQSDAMFYKNMILEGEDLNCIETGFQALELRELFEKKLAELDETFAFVLKYRYGLFNLPELTQEEIALKLDTSQGNVSKIERKALDCFGKNLFLEYSKLI